MEQQAAEKKIEKQLSEKEILLREVHHRLKNNIVNIEALLSQQIRSSENADVKTALGDALSRIQSVRILYDRLLLSKDYREVPVKDYIEGLIESQREIYHGECSIDVKKSIADFTINRKEAVPLGMIVSELLSNVFKYAFPDRSEGEVSVSLEMNEGAGTLIIHDNGIGVDQRRQANKTPGFGLTIVGMLAEQLQGDFTVENRNGTRSVVRFKC